MTQKMQRFRYQVLARFPATHHVNLALHANDYLSCGLQAPQVLLRKQFERLLQRCRSETFQPIMGPCVYAVGAFCRISPTLMPSTVLKLPCRAPQRNLHLCAHTLACIMSGPPLGTGLKSTGACMRSRSWEARTMAVMGATPCARFFDRTQENNCHSVYQPQALASSRGCELPDSFRMSVITSRSQSRNAAST